MQWRFQALSLDFSASFVSVVVVPALLYRFRRLTVPTIGLCRKAVAFGSVAIENWFAVFVAGQEAFPPVAPAFAQMSIRLSFFPQHPFGMQRSRAPIPRDILKRLQHEAVLTLAIA